MAPTFLKLYLKLFTLEELTSSLKNTVEYTLQPKSASTIYDFAADSLGITLFLL
jgi:hypothetical protein